MQLNGGLKRALKKLIIVRRRWLLLSVCLIKRMGDY
mgnify:CR=1 FL=1